MNTPSHRRDTHEQTVGTIWAARDRDRRRAPSHRGPYTGR